MISFRISLMSLLTAAASAGLAPQAVQAGCPCQNGGGSVGLSPIPATTMSGPYASPYTGGADAYGYAGDVPSSTMPGAGVNPMSPTVAQRYGGAAQTSPKTDPRTATTWEPPPGTIGRTYRMKSRPVPVSMHPRAAIVDVRVKGASEVRVHGMNVYRTEDFLEGFQDHREPDMWHFQADPLMPGLKHIYRIEARFNGPEGPTMQERYVRLIMGRVIEVEF